MTLDELRESVNKLPKNAKLAFGLSEPFSWRGIYAEVAFSVTESMSRYTILKHIEQAYDECFEGWKGGDFRYDGSTEVHFESSEGDYTGGGYAEQKIKEFEKDYISDPEAKLISLIMEAK